MSLYVDGVKVGSNPTTTNQSYEGYWRVGEDNLNSWPSQPTSSFFQGSIDDPSVYNSALTPAQVAAQYTAAGYTVRGRSGIDDGVRQASSPMVRRCTGASTSQSGRPPTTCPATATTARTTAATPLVSRARSPTASRRPTLR